MLIVSAYIEYTLEGVGLKGMSSKKESIGGKKYY